MRMDNMVLHKSYTTMARRGGLAVIFSLLVFAAGGCGLIDHSGDEPDDGLGTGAGLSDQALAGQTSLDQFEATGEVSEGGEMSDVYFAFDSSALGIEANEAIQIDADYLIAHAEVNAEVEGHCDDRGTADYNLALGARRAKAVRDAIVARGVAGDRISTVSYGEELPVCKEETQSCRSRNRRGHLVDLSQR